MDPTAEISFEDSDIDGIEGIEKSTRFKEKHSLDSDEEDEVVKYDVLAEDDIEGQEEATIDFDEDIQITPFNMREEMEEGHFDSDGTYIFDKTKEIHDSWIDNIDWVKVKHTTPEEEANKKRPFQYDDDSDSDEEKTKANTISLYEEILKIVKEGETIGKAIRRLGRNKAKIPTSSQRWKNKRLKKSVDASALNEAEIEQAKLEQKEMLHLTELCDQLVQQGLVEIYDIPYERVTFTLKQLKEKEKASRLTIADTVKDGDALDMFADDFDSKESKQMKDSHGGNDVQANVSKESADSELFKKPGPADPASGKSSGVLWEYKVSEDADVKGPFPNSQMMTWAEDGTFEANVLCRKYQSTGQFYSVSRIDFDLYE